MGLPPEIEPPKSGGADPIIVPPDVVEHQHPDEIDNIVPTRGYQMTPMVALGGSAGSIQALSEFFRSMPPKSGMIFVVVVHLSPTHESTKPSSSGVRRRCRSSRLRMGRRSSRIMSTSSRPAST
ncbi:MAG: chemotaxis protein CheB [Isosphaeraceae bacterium]